MSSAIESDIELWEVSNRDYHTEKNWLGNSALSLYEEDPYLFWQWLNGQYNRPQTDALRIGTGVDAILSGEFSEECAVHPVVNGRTNDGKAEKAMFAMQNRHKTILSPDEFDKCHEMADAVRKDDSAMSLLGAPGKWQVSCRWTHKATGQGLKVRFDYLLDSGDEVQLKTRRRPQKGRDHFEQWERDMWEHAYYRQAALYTIARHKLGYRGSMHYFVTVYNEPPYDVFVYETDKSWLDLGRLHLKQLLHSLAERKQSGNWKPRGHGKINLCSAPDWALNRTELSL